MRVKMSNFKEIDSIIIRHTQQPYKGNIYVAYQERAAALAAPGLVSTGLQGRKSCCGLAMDVTDY